MSYCINCGSKLEPHHKFCVSCGTSLTGEKPSVIQTTSDDLISRTADYKFKTLLGYGKAMSGFGWLIIAAAGICFLFAIYGLSIKSDLWIAFMIAAPSLILFGIPFVVSGQVISCFVEIEKNTRLTYQNLTK